MDTYAVIGGGAIGLNIARQLVEYNKKVDLYSTTLQSVSYNYGIGLSKDTYINTSFIGIDDYKWFLFYILLNLINRSYLENKNYLLKESSIILKKYDIFITECDDTYFLNVKNMLDKIIYFLQHHNNFKYFNKTININGEELDLLSDRYKHIFICIGANTDESIYNKKIAGYKIYIKSEIKPDCLVIDKPFFLNTEDNLLVIRGGFLMGNTLIKNLFNKIKNLPFWDKYKCSEIVNIIKDYRSVSLDNFPYYYSTNNVTHIKGGSFSGCFTAPSLSKSIVTEKLFGNNPINFNFHINRLNNHIQGGLLILISMFLIIVIMIKYYR